MLPIGLNNLPVLQYRMDIEQLSALAEIAATKVMEIRLLDSVLSAEASRLLNKPMYTSGWQYKKLCDRKVMLIAMCKSPHLKLHVLDAVNELMAFIEQHRYRQRNHHSSSMFWQGAE